MANNKYYETPQDQVATRLSNLNLDIEERTIQASIYGSSWMHMEFSEWTDCLPVSF